MLVNCFNFIKNKKNKNEVNISDVKLCTISSSNQINTDKVVNKFGFSLTIQHDTKINQLSCTIGASLDLFNIETVEKMSERFHVMLKQLFLSINDQMKKHLSEAQ